MEFYCESQETKEINTALSKFKKSMPAVKRDAEVKMKGQSKSGKDFELSYEYAPLEIIQEKAKTYLADNGLAVTQFLTMAVLGNNQLVEGIMTRISHESGQWIRAFWPIQMDGITKEQDRGSKITYNKRYAYVAALDIALVDEDNDAQGVEKEIDPFEYVLKMGPNNRLTGTKIKEHNLVELSGQLEKTLDYYKGQNKPPHANVLEFKTMLEKAIALNMK